MFDRAALGFLEEWKDREGRKPLVVRGARQVGKSALVRLFGARSFRDMVELNFEFDPALPSLFRDPDPAVALRLVEARYRKTVVPGETLLFLDEVQVWPEILMRLRYFHERMPALHVVAAGSLLDIALKDASFSTPVGRIEYLHLGPVQFEEFLDAAGEERLCSFLREWTAGQEIPEAIHVRLLELFREFVLVGGMPEAVDVFVKSGSLVEADMVKNAILATYRDDFAKYGERVSTERLRKTFARVPFLVGRRFKFSHVDREERSKDLGAAVELLQLARVIWRVHHSSGNGVPLDAEVDERKFKVLFLDVGLMLAAAGLDIVQTRLASDLNSVHSGAVAEQAVGQHILYSRQAYHQPELHFWLREARNSSAEVDYLMSEGGIVVPVEVKAGKAGTLRSLQLFLAEKKLSLGVRVCSAPPQVVDSRSGSPSNPRPFRLLSIPFYLVGQLRRLVREMAG